MDAIACEQVEQFFEELKKNPCYRGAEHTLSILTITSNVMYGKKTGSTPDGRKGGEPFAPGANPMGRPGEKRRAGRPQFGWPKLRYDVLPGWHFQHILHRPGGAGENRGRAQVANLVAMLDGYFTQGAHHINVNVLNRETLMDAYDHPELYPTLTIRVSGYAVNFVRLSREQQREVISRTFHQAV